MALNYLEPAIHPEVYPAIEQSIVNIIICPKTNNLRQVVPPMGGWDYRYSLQINYELCSVIIK